jgi:hypothetical protein
MDMKRAAALVTAVLFLVLALSGVALAATAQEIYDDYMTDGKLDGNYTDAELQTYVGDATLRQYGDPTIVTSLDTVVSSMLTEERSNFPFTGAQLALMGTVVLALVGGGVGLRRLARSRD